MRWKVLSLGLLLILFAQCGEDSTTTGKAETLGKPVTAEVFEFRTPEELRDFRFPLDTKGTLGFRVTKVDKELQPFRSTPIFVTDGQHSLNDAFIDTELVRIIVFR